MTNGHAGNMTATGSEVRDGIGIHWNVPIEMDDGASGSLNPKWQRARGDGSGAGKLSLNWMKRQGGRQTAHQPYGVAM